MANLRKFSKLIACLRVPSYRSVLVRHRVAAGIEHEPVLRNLNCLTVVDIGANRGQFALAARHAFPCAKIVSFEPLSRPANRFRAVFAGNNQISLYQAGIGPEHRRAAIHVSFKDDSSSLLPITSTQQALFPGTGEVGTTEIAIGPLEDFVPADSIEAPALLKLDVQGYELEALRGCESLLHRFAHVYCECSYVELYEGQALADEVIAWLRERGFALRDIHNVHYDRSGRAIQADFLFVRS